jgi:hypothetical protein
MLTPKCPSEERGGYKTQEVPLPPSTPKERSKRKKEKGNNQKDKLFNRTKTISVTPTKRGNKRFPKLPIKIGITAKKIIIKP